MGVLVSVAALHLPRSGALLVSVLSVSPAIIDVITESVGLEVAVAVVIVVLVVMSTVVVAGEGRVHADGGE